MKLRVLRRLTELALTIPEMWAKMIQHRFSTSRDPDPWGSAFTGHLDAASGTGGGDHHRRDGERADGVKADAGSGRGGAPVSSGTIERRLCLSVSGWSELASAATHGTQTGADAGGVWHPARWQPSPAGFLAQPGRKPSGLGRVAAGSVPARPGGPIARPDSHRRLRRLGGGDSHGLSPGAASALLGAQDAQHFGESTEVRLRRGEGGPDSWGSAFMLHSWACGAAGSALPWHGRGRRFDPDQVHQISQWFSSHRHFDPEVLQARRLVFPMATSVLRTEITEAVYRSPRNNERLYSMATFCVS